MNPQTLEIPVKNEETGAAQPQLWKDEFHESLISFPRSLSRLLMVLSILLLSLPTPAAERHDTIVILLDASGSMKINFPGSRGSRMDGAKDALKTVIRKVPLSTQVGLLVFSAANLKNDWAYPLGPRNDAQLFATLDSIEPRTDTPLGKYIKIAADRLLEERGKNFGYGTYRLIIVTDGEAQDQNLVERYTPEVIARGITVDVIGVGMKTAHTLAKKVHSYRGATDSTALNQALDEVFAEVHGGGKDNSSAEVFAMIAPLPEGVANAMIQAVANTPNQPIGDQTFAPPASKAIQQSTEPAPPAIQPPQSKSHKQSKRTNWPAVVIVLVVLSVIRKGVRARRGGRRR